MGKDVFSANLDITKNAYMNWKTDRNDPAHNLHVLASDYAEGAIALINSVLLDNSDKKADALIMPILYCINQSIEVYFKAIIWEIDELSGVTPRNFKTHDIAGLKNTAVSEIEKKETSAKGLEKHLRPVSSYIDDLYKHINVAKPGGSTRPLLDFARYPITSEGDPHFYIIASDIVIVDVENLGQRFSEIQGSLEALYLKYASEKENKL